nr:activating transcription factor 7-interacting protein 1 isoform X2 [Doryrhamphus excisus]XP_057926495.1 activating transcription factor 7-interacting protein 1 isoform X2 [Doryrhamphus excisus]XP_057926503.1 activating transcription factor 7-interacting protein 1 isoform X2 [Doryrhamphus excisus]XP_057926511.1 activating transcription factor 7-interacting protein 1 isoform X2 [Doryrhamphus excisus]XP_057926519.1 activating transcription factor 7-interacting protein 1 isoform X2 [Doryrhamphus
MEVVVAEEKKKIFRARKTMKISDRQQLEVLHGTLFTAATSSSEPSIPLMNGSHKEDGQKSGEAEQNSHQDSNSPIPTSPASQTSLSSPAPFLSLSLSPSPVPSQSPKEKDDSAPSSPFHSINFELKKLEDEKTDLSSPLSKETVEAAAKESKEQQDEDGKVLEETEEDQTATEGKANDSNKDLAKELASRLPPPVSDCTILMETDTTPKAKHTAPTKSSISLTSISSTPTFSVDINQDVKEEMSGNEETKKGLIKDNKIEVDFVKVDTKKEKVEVGQKSSRPSSTPPSNTASDERNFASGLKRTLSEGFDSDGQALKREGKRPKMERGELEAELELKITAKAGSHHKLEKIVQQLVEERLRILEMSIFEKNFLEMKGRVDKIDCANKHQTAIHTLQAKIARLSKKFGEANQASENKRKQEALAASAAVAASASAAAVKSTVASTPQVQRPVVRASMEVKQPSATTVTIPYTNAKSVPPSPAPAPAPTSTAMVSQAPIIKLITSTPNAVSTLATGITTQSSPGTLVLKTAPGSGVMATGQPLLIQLPLSMANGQTGTLVNIPVSSLSAASSLNKPKTTASTATFIIKSAPVTTTAAASIPAAVTVPALQAPTGQMPAGQISLARAVYQGGAGGISTPSAGVSVTTARTVAQPVSVAGAMSTVSSSATSGPAATGSAAPGPPQGTSLTSKTDNQATGFTPSKVATPGARPKGSVIDLTEDDDDVMVTGVKAATVPAPSPTQRSHTVSIPSSSGARSSPQSSQNTSSSNPSAHNRPQLESSTKSRTSSTTTPSRGSSTTLPPLPAAPTPMSLPPEAQRTSPPQQPQLKLVPSQTGIVLSWCVSETDLTCAAVESYHLYAYHQDSNTNSSSNAAQQHWKKIGEVKALPLPMACTLTQFQSGSTYHFAVRAKDIYGRFGSFCEPQCTNVINSSSN